MAGSWRHMTTRTGELRDPKSFNGMIENGGDAYEAAQQCYGMIWYLASVVAQYRSMEAAQAPSPSREIMLGVINEARLHYKDGLKLGGVQRER